MADNFQVLDALGRIKQIVSASTVSLTTGVTGVLPAANGGTGLSSYAIGDLLYASAATTLAKLADIATGNALISGGVATAPSWGKIDLAVHITGTLPVTNGGTGLATVAQGDLLYGSAANTLSKLAKSTASAQYLKNSGTNNNPVWAAIPDVLPPGSDNNDNVGMPAITLFPSSSANVTSGGTSQLGTAQSGAIQSDSAGIFCRSTSSVNATPAIYRLAGANNIGIVDNLVYLTRIRTGSDITNVRFFIGFVSGGDFPNNSDTLATNGVAIRYSTSAADAGWVGVNNTGGAQSTTANPTTTPIAAIAANTLYNLRIDVTATLVTFTVDNASLTLASNIPTGVDMRAQNFVVRISTANKVLDTKWIRLWR